MKAAPESRAFSIAPVERRVNVALSPEQAFDLFTRDLASWWPLGSHSCSGDASASVVFGGGAGSAVVEIAGDGTRHVWGSLLAWDPPHGFEMSWHPGQSVEQATRVRVRFAPSAVGSELHLVHDGWDARGAEAATVRESYDNGWPRVLARFVDKAEGTT